MKEQQETVKKYVTDMLAVEEHILEAVHRQIQDDMVVKTGEAHQLLAKTEKTLQRHVEILQNHVTTLGGSPGSSVKETVTKVLGVAAGMIDRVRPDKVSEMLRDDYTALNLAAVSYTMLHTTSLALYDQATASVALDHLNDLTPLITEINEKIPQVVVKEITNEAEMVDGGAADEAIRRTQQAWDGEHVHKGHAHPWKK